MEVVDHKVGVPMEHYKAVFAAADPAALSERSRVPYADGVFSLTLLGRPVTVSWPDMVSRFADDGAETASNTRILLARLLLEGSLTPAGGKLLAYTDMPWGNVYAQQFRGRCILRLAGTYGHSLPSFEAACLSVAGTAAERGDRSFDLPVLPEEAEEPTATDDDAAGAEPFAEPADATGFDDNATPATETSPAQQQDNALDEFLF